MLQEQTALELLQKVEIENLYEKLILQINKDFQLSNLSYEFSIAITPSELKEDLAKLLQKMITYHYDDYLNFVYRVDVSEKELLAIKSDNLDETIDQLTFVILKREYQKVWFKNKL